MCVEVDAARDQDKTRQKSGSDVTSLEIMRDD